MGGVSLEYSTAGGKVWRARPLGSFPPLHSRLRPGAFVTSVPPHYHTPATHGLHVTHRAAAQFLVGTEQGKVVACNRKAKNPSDRVGTIYEGHCGPVYALARSHPLSILTSGQPGVRSLVIAKNRRATLSSPSTL